MTTREQVIQTKLRLLNQRGSRCEVCGKQLTLDTCQLAHRIPKTKYNLKTYGAKVIHHDLNLAVVCSLQCNSAVLCNIATNPVEAGWIIKKIREAIA